METKSKSPRPENHYSPLPAWTHYDVIKYAEEQVKKAVEEQLPEGLMAGLAVGYLFLPKEQSEPESAIKFSMAYGYRVETEAVDEEQSIDLPIDEPGPKSKDSEPMYPMDGLDEGFIDQLYNQVRDQILQNVSPDLGEYLVRLEVTTAHCSTPTYAAQGRQCKYCTISSHSGKKHLWKKNSAGVWYCTGNSCTS